MFDLVPSRRCPAIADKLTGIFSWRHTYRVHHRHKGIAQGSHGHLHKTYSLQLPNHNNNNNNDKKNADSWVVVHHLQSQSGILDPDDKLNDVADDREQIIASYDDCIGPDPGVPQGGGDGASGSSVGTGSPDIFTRSESKFPLESTHIEVTSSEQTNTSGLGLQVRRGSEPSLHQIGDSPHQSNQPYINVSGNNNTSGSGNNDPTKRWSAAPVCRSDTDPPERLLAHHIATLNGTNISSATTTVPEVPEEIPYSSHNESSHSNFSRSGRLSMQFLGDGGGYKWLDAADRLAANNTSFNSHQNVSNSHSYYNSKSLPREAKRKEPLGQANAHESLREKNGEMLLVINEQGSPLGLTAIPDPENGGLLVQHVEPGSRAEKGRLRRGDLIVEINSIQLIGLGDKTIQEQLRRNLQSSELRLRVIRSSKSKNRDNRVSKLIDSEGKVEQEKPKSANVKTSPSRKVPGATASASLQVANTRKLGRKIEIILKKGPQGLGFSVTTRDNPAGGYCPIYIKNILPKGAAVEDGRLKSGDRLLEVDGVTMTGKSQTEVVGILRATQPGATVRLMVSRQQELADVEEREIGCGAEQQETKDTPPKPPAPVMPTSSAPAILKSPSKTVNPLPVPEKPTSTTSNKNDRPAHLNLSASLRLKRRSSGGSQTSPVYAGFNLQDNNSVFPWRNREILTLHIPVHDTEKAGLGVSVKGKTGSPNNSTTGGSGNSNNGVNLKNDGDLGIFVKSVIHGGAASRDGRLKMNDQLLSVNGVSLLGQSNAEAMDTLRRAMLHTGGKYPGSITLTVARRISRPASIGDPLEGDHNSTTSENSGATVVYLNSSDTKDKLNASDSSMNRWSNPVLDRLTGGTGCVPGSARPTMKPSTSAMRNESYYMATNETWSPTGLQLNGNSAVLIEEDPEPTSPTLLPNHRINESHNKTNLSQFSMQNGDVAYDSQLSLETNPSVDAFNRDAIGRRSMSEKHHAALDAKETGTYQRNKKLREERERREKLKMALSGSMESVTDAVRNSKNLSKTGDLRGEEADKVTDLGPSLGLKKSSSLESLQTMVQEIQMSDEPRGPVSLKTPRGPGRAEQLRAVVEGPSQDSKPRKHWLLEEADQEGGFTNRNSPFQSSLNDPKRSKQKKPGLFKGIGHMFRFGKHRKDGVAPVQPPISNPTPVAAVQQDIGGLIKPESNGWLSKSDEDTRKHANATLPAVHGHQRSSPAVITTQPKERNGPPQYVSPPPAPTANANPANSTTLVNGQPTAIHQNDLFNHRYSHYVNYDELQHHLSRRHHIYHSTRSTRELSTHHANHSGSGTSTLGHNFNSRPISTYYEYETATFQPQGSFRKVSNSPIISVQHNKVLHHQQLQQQYPQWNNNNNSTPGSSIKNRGPFVTQVTIRDQNSSGNNNQPPASKV
ncbi:partitioning defective 3 homolog isoform X2 [Culicoides brevitarsis]|uniref:partitioning defective 3 homolog isoform X2 n=1 Tax=Culicoides brevitarsis TaxID=469753 RepID=UPI00307BDEF7